MPGDHTLINLLDPGDTLDITISPEYEITGLSLAGHEVAIYRFVSATGVESGDGALPEAGLRLEQNHPNPFNPSTEVSFEIRRSDHLTIEIFDVSGKHVRTMPLGYVGAGPHRVRWDGRDASGDNVASGVYFVRLRGTADISNAVRAVLVR